MQLVDGRLTLSPSDLNGHVECEHLTTLALEVAQGLRSRPHLPDEHGELIRRKGEEHEAAYLARLKAEGRPVVEITLGEPWDFRAAARATEDAMRAGAEVIYQATFVLGNWRGRADFLERIERETDLGPWGYEAVDTKLARAETPNYIFQLCFYTEGIRAVQGAVPERMYVLLGIGERRSFRYADFAAYYRRVRAGFEVAVQGGGATQPYPVEHCSLCNFREVCDARWEQEDHLVLVAGMRRGQVDRLRAAGISTLSSLAATEPGTVVQRLQPHTFDALRDQAGLQRIRRTSTRLDWHLLPDKAGRGLALMPRPSAGDLVLDIEGDPFWEPARGLHFLFGLFGVDGQPWYRPIWGHDREGERRAFETLIDTIHERLARHPDMHVFHYGAYEQTALKQLMGVYATREEAVDDLLRRRVFVDLLTVVRQALRAGVSSYSLKEVEILAGFERVAEVRSGTVAVLDYERWMASNGSDLLSKIAAYNEEDCRATLALRDWLLGQRPGGGPWLELAIPREIDDERREALEGREALRLSLIDGAPLRSLGWLAGELLEYHRREARPAWWWFFERCDHMTPDELVDDAEAIGKLEPVGRRPERDKQSLIHSFRFPTQQHKLWSGDEPVDPATRKSAGTIRELDEAAGVLRLRRGPSLSAIPLPKALILPGPYRTEEQRGALTRLATSVRAGDGRYPALLGILGRTPPRFRAPARSRIQTTELGELRELAVSLDGSYLFVQGPPGTGKTWRGARLVVDLMRRGRRVGITATSHKVIHNLLDAIEEAAKDEGLAFRGLKKASTGNPESEYTGAFITSTDAIENFTTPPPDVSLFAGTAWLFARQDVDAYRGRAPLVDTLVIDEAGQVSLADALAMGTAARNLVLLGDPLQLAQVSQGVHPPGTGASVLEHLLGDWATIPTDMGVFLERTRRMHPDICRFISEVVYDGRLSWIPEMERQTTALGTGLRYLPVEHEGHGAWSPEEAERVAEHVRRMLGAAYTDTRGEMQPLRQDDFMVVAPYNAQVRCLRTALGTAGLGNVPVGTVDKFQGQEAPVVFYSMATSSVEEVPRNLEFLFSRNRLNVAVSRAKCLAYVVASPRLLESRARTIEQMRLINALCRFVEMAEESA